MHGSGLGELQQPRCDPSTLHSGIGVPDGTLRCVRRPVGRAHSTEKSTPQYQQLSAMQVHFKYSEYYKHCMLEHSFPQKAGMRKLLGRTSRRLLVVI